MPPGYIYLTPPATCVTFGAPNANYNQDHVSEPATARELDNLMSMYQQADAAAASAFVAAASPALYRYFLYHCRDREAAMDLLQETWLRLHRVRQTYRPGESVLPWIYAIARHVRVDGYRRKRHIESHEQATDILPETASKAGPSRSSLPDFAALVAALSPTQREIVTMLKVSGMSLEEVARATRSTVGAVKQKAHRAYEKLRALKGNAESPGTAGWEDQPNDA